MIHLTGYLGPDKIKKYMDRWNLFKVMTIEFDKNKNNFIFRVFWNDGSDVLIENMFENYREADFFYKALERS